MEPWYVAFPVEETGIDAALQKTNTWSNDCAAGVLCRFVQPIQLLIQPDESSQKIKNVDWFSMSEIELKKQMDIHSNTN